MSFICNVCASSAGFSLSLSVGAANGKSVLVCVINAVQEGLAADLFPTEREGKRDTGS